MDALFRETLLAGEDRRLGIERVEDRLDENEVGPAVDQPVDLLAISLSQVVEGDRAVAGIVDVRRDRGGAVRRTDRARDEAAATVFLLRSERSPAGETRTVPVEIVDGVLHLVIRLRDAGGGEGVRLDDVCACHGVAVVDFLDRLRLCKDEEVVIALLVAGAAGEPVAAKLVLVEAEPLDLRSHGAVDDEDALARSLAQRGKDFVSVLRRRLRTEQLVEHGYLLHMRTP